MQLLGRLLQIVGLVMPPLAIVLQLGQNVTVSQMLTMLVAGLASFYLGRMIEGYAAH